VTQQTQPQSFRSSIPYNPRIGPDASSGWLGAVGRRAIGSYDRALGLLQTLIEALGSVSTPGLAARTTVRGIMLAQVLYTGAQALSLISVIALLLGASIIIQTKLMVVSVDGELLGKILVAVVLRELAPLITAIVVAGRSGTAIATELGNMQVNKEILALSALGIDPPRFVVLPRLVATVVSVLVLMIYFSVVACLGAVGIGLASSGAAFGSLRSGIAEGLLPFDLALFLLKGAGLGVIVGWLGCHFGLQVKSSPTEVPQQASRAVVMSLLGIVVFNTAVTATFYWISGPPLR
jgi:phospholipid/cholesterol/gamma-HCH transport system permease protein